MKKSNRVVIVTELFFPEETSTAYIMTCFADHISKDNEVIVITGPESYESENKKISSNIINTNKMVVKRIFVPNFNKNKLISRAIRHIFISIGLTLNTILYIKSGDVLLSVTNPAPLLIFSALIKKVRNIKYILLVHDIFPESLVATGIIKSDSPIYKITKLIFDQAYKIPDLIITIGRDMAEIIELKLGSNNKEKVKIVENWSEVSLVKPIPRLRSRIPELGLEKKIVIQYAGNIGRAQGILDFAQFTKFIDNDYIHFMYVGSGALRLNLEEQLCNSKNSSILGAFSRDQQTIILGSCDIALVILGRTMYGLGVPSKTYNIMASGKPILFLGPKNSEIYRLVNDFDIGWAFDWESLELMKDFINSMKLSDLDLIQRKGLLARKISEELYTKELAMGKFKEAMNI